MRNPAYSTVDIDINAINAGVHEANCRAYYGTRALEPCDLIITHIPGRFVAYAFDEAGRMLMVDTQAIETEEAN